nr:hypothetical protein [Bacteroidota bacterium]
MLAVLFSAIMFAQVFSGERPIQEEFVESGYFKVTNEIGDFTVTDSDGNTWNLYELLESGKTVFIDLFFTS